MKHKLTLLILLITLPKIILALSEHDFAYIAETQTNGNTPYYELEIPTVVYETISRPDLGDLRVLNGNGHVVPHGLRRTAIQRNKKTETKKIPFYPLYQQAGQSISNLHLNIKRNAQGEVINIHSRLPNNEQNNRLAGYLIDLREWKNPVNQLKIIWKNSDNTSFIRKLKISKSSNLERWRLIASGKTLVNLSYQNHHLMENTINIYSAKTNYLQLLFQDQKPGLEIESIEVKYTQSSTYKKQNWKNISIHSTTTAGEYTFQNQLKSLARQLDIKLPENNTVVNVQVLSRTNNEQPWRYRGSTLLYRLSVNGTDIEKTKINISPNRDNQWLLRFNQQGGGIGYGTPQIKLSWYPQQLVFVARGQAPYRVVWGSAKVKSVNINANQLLPHVPNNAVSDANMISTALFLTDTTRAINKQALEPKAKEINWRHWILWIALIAAALMLIYMAVRLMKKMAES